jgi:hypothetical protein
LNPGRTAVSLPAKLAEQWRLWVARLACFAGLRAFARNVAKSAVRRNPVSFRARFLLGRLYLLETAVTKARREFDLAWQIDPDRFEAAYARLKVRFHGAPELLAALAATGELPWEEPGTEAGAARLADFRDEEEARRFAGLPPIAREELETIDWDRFQEEIFRDQDRQR